MFVIFKKKHYLCARFVENWILIEKFPSLYNSAPNVLFPKRIQFLWEEFCFRIISV